MLSTVLLLVVPGMFYPLTYVDYQSYGISHHVVLKPKLWSYWFHRMTHRNAIIDIGNAGSQKCVEFMIADVEFIITNPAIIMSPLDSAHPIVGFHHHSLCHGVRPNTGACKQIYPSRIHEPFLYADCLLW